MLEYFTNIYIFPLIGVILGLFVYHFYHKIDDKNYLTKGDYFKCAVLIYLVCFAILFLQQNMVLASALPNGKGSEITDIASVDLDADNIFSTGHPSF
jgi:hypothetical protein